MRRGEVRYVHESRACHLLISHAGVVGEQIRWSREWQAVRRRAMLGVLVVVLMVAFDLDLHLRRIILDLGLLVLRGETWRCCTDFVFMIVVRVLAWCRMVGVCKVSLGDDRGAMLKLISMSNSLDL